MISRVLVPVHTRIGVWLAEILLEVVFFAPLLVILFGRSNGKSLGDDLLLWLAATAFFVLASGYWATTAIVAVLLRNRPGWIYASGCYLLFIVHEQLSFKGMSSPDVSDLKIQFVGGGVVWAIALGGTWLAQTRARLEVLPKPAPVK